MVIAAGLTPFSHGDYDPGRRFYFYDWDGIDLCLFGGLQCTAVFDQPDIGVGDHLIDRFPAVIEAAFFAGCAMGGAQIFISAIRRHRLGQPHAVGGLSALFALQGDQAPGDIILNQA